MSNKLHELLAVEGDLKEVTAKILKEARNTFKEKPAHFTAALRVVEMFEENAVGEDPAHQEMVTTVDQKLKYVQDHVVRYYDAVLQKEIGNQTATENIIVNGETLIENVPVTFLLGLESKLGEIRGLYNLIPTLAPGIAWELDVGEGEGVYKMTHPAEKFRTARTVKHKVLYEATKEHPAQIEKWNEDVKVGKIVTTQWSGMLKPADKSTLLRRIDDLIQGVKKARQRANNCKIEPVNIGSKLFDYIHQ